MPPGHRVLATSITPSLSINQATAIITNDTREGRCQVGKENRKSASVTYPRATDSDCKGIKLS